MERRIIQNCGIFFLALVLFLGSIKEAPKPTPLLSHPIFVNRFLAANLSKQFNLEDIPDGYPPGRSEAAYGSYNTPFSAKAKVYGDFLEKLENKTFGLSHLASRDEVEQAEITYYLENMIIGTYQKILQLPDAELTPFERSALQFQSLRIYKGVRVHAERLTEVMVRRIDVALPGPNGIQLRTEQNFGNGVLYDTNGRSEKPLSAAERKMFYEKKLADFLNEGGSLKELNVLSPQSLEQIPSSKSGVSHYEYVERPNGEVWVTEGKAGHLLLAGGGQAQSAGQIVIVKNGKEIALLIASNASGNYKPDLYSVERMALNLSKSLGVPYDRVIVTKGDPLGTQAVSILMKARKIEKALIKEKVSEMEAVATSLINAPSPIFRSSPIIPPDCSLVLSKTNPTHDVK